MQYLCFMLLALALLASCLSSPDQSPCADVDCSGHGTCVVAAVGAESFPTCQCVEGYAPTPSGMLCLAATDSSMCAGITCSDHGHCVSLQGLPWCMCEEGYQVSDDGMTCEDPCAEIDCSGHGACEATDQGPRCSCNEGYRSSLDGASCELIPTSDYVIYKLIEDEDPDSPVGRMTLDLTRMADGELVELMQFSIWILGRTTRQIWTLDSGQQQVTRLEFDDSFTQGHVSRRRWGLASFSHGAADLTIQRLDHLATIPASYTGSAAPIPMLGAYEYPGWTLGCFSAAFYMQAYQRFDAAASDPQELEVFWPGWGIVARVRVEKGPGHTPQKPVLFFVDQQVQVSYSDGLPQTIKLLDQEMSWERYDGANADLNLNPLDESVPYEPSPLPTDLTEAPVNFTSADGTQLLGTLALPANEIQPVPAVLMVSDLAASNRDIPFARLPQPLFQHLAAHLAHAGYATLRYDARGLGASQGDRSAATLQQMAQDATGAHDFLSTHPAVDATRIYVLSHGTGSMVALSILGAGVTVQGHVALAPVVHQADQMLIYSATKHIEASGMYQKYVDYQKQHYQDMAQQIADGTLEAPEYKGIPVTLWQDWLSFDGMDALTSFIGPVLLLRGAEDLETPPEQLDQAQIAAQDAQKTNLTAQTLPGLTFMLTEGSMSSLWETAALPLDLPASALSSIIGWLDQN